MSEMPLLLETEHKVSSTPCPFPTGERAREGLHNVEHLYPVPLPSREIEHPRAIRKRLVFFARMTRIVFVVYLLLTLLGLIPGEVPQEDLPENDPFPSAQLMQSDAAHVVSGAVVIGSPLKGGWSFVSRQWTADGG